MCINYLDLKEFDKDLYILAKKDGDDTLFGWKLHVALRDFVEKGYRFVFIKRYKYETKLEKNWWDSLAKSYERCYGKKLELTQDGNKLFVNGELAGKIVSLSDAVEIKSLEWENYRNIGFDEYIEDNKFNYISGDPKNEPADYFWRIVSAVFRYLPEELSKKVKVHQTFDMNGKTVTKELPEDLLSEIQNFSKTQKVYMFSSIKQLINPYTLSLGLFDDDSDDVRGTVYLDKNISAI